MNNFKELEKLQEEQYKNNLLGLKSRMDSNLGVLSAFTKIIDLYFSKLIKYLISWSGGSSEDVENKSNENN